MPVARQERQFYRAAGWQCDIEEQKTMIGYEKRWLLGL